MLTVARAVGGVAAPDAIFGSDLKLWRRSDSGLSASGGVVDSWTGTGPGAAAALSDRPADVPSDPHLDGHRTVDFDGTDDWLAISTAVYGTGASDWICWAVVDADDRDANPQMVFDCWDGASDRLALAFQDGPGGGSVGFYDGVAWRTAGASKRGAQILVWDLRAGVGTARVYRDSVQLGAALDYSAVHLGGTYTSIGSIFDGTAWHFDGAIAEIGVARLPSDARRDALFAYLAARYPLDFQKKVDAVTALSHVRAVFLADRGVAATGGVADSWESAKAGVTAFSQIGASRPAVEASGFGAGRPALLHDGADDYMSAGQIDEWMTATDGYVYALFEPLTFAVADPGAGFYYQADSVWATSGGYTGLGFYQAANVSAYNFSGGYQHRTAPTAAGRQVARWRHTGGSLYLRAGGGAETAGVASGATGSTTATNRIGANPGATGNFAHMRLAAIVAGDDGALSAGDDAAIVAMLKAY